MFFRFILTHSVKHFSIWAFMVLLLASCSEDTIQDQPSETKSTIEKIDIKESMTDSSAVLRIDSIVNKMEQQEREGSYDDYELYIFYDEHGEKHQLGLDKGWRKQENYSISITTRPDAVADGPSHISTSFYFEKGQLCLFRVENIGHGRWQDDQHENYYFNKEDYDLFYHTYRAYYKDELVTDTGFVFTKFKGDEHCFIWDKKDLEALLKNSVPKKHLVVLDEFDLVNGFTNGCDMKGLCERTATTEQLETIYWPEGIKMEEVAPEDRLDQYQIKLSLQKNYDQATNKSTVSGAYAYQGKKGSFNSQFDGVIKCVGAVDEYVLIETVLSPFDEGYELVVLNALTGKVEYRAEVKGHLIKNGKLYLIKPLNEERILGAGYDVACLELLSEGYGSAHFQKCGVFRLEFGVSKAQFTNQLICYYLQ